MLRKLFATLSTTTGKVLATLAALATIYAVVFPPSPPPSPPPQPIIVQPDAAALDLAVLDADLQVQSKRHGVLGFELGRDYYDVYRLTIMNRTGAALGGCMLQAEYSGQTIRGNGALFHGSWFDNSGGLPFDLPADPTYAGTFYRVRPWDQSRPLDWARVQLHCATPQRRVSQWRDVDLSRTRWD